MTGSKTEVLAFDETLAGYDRWARAYDGGDNPMIAATTWALDGRPLAVGGARVIELACGTGRHARRILDGGAVSYTGVDGSPGMLAIARAHHDDPRCAWIEGDLSAPPVDAEAFELALIVLALEHVADLDRVIGAAARVVVPGGTLRIVEIHPDLVAAGTVAHFHDRTDGAEVRFASVAHPVAEIRAALARAGLTLERLDEDVAAGALLAAAPRVGKHAGRRVLLDLSARR